MDKARAGGVQIVESIDKQPFQDAVKPVWDNMVCVFPTSQTHPSRQLNLAVSGPVSCS